MAGQWPTWIPSQRRARKLCNAIDIAAIKTHREGLRIKRCELVNEILQRCKSHTLPLAEAQQRAVMGFGKQKIKLVLNLMRRNWLRCSTP